VTLDSSAADDDAWIRKLTQGFGALLGRPLSEFDPDAVYAAFFGGNWINEIGFRRDKAWVAPDALAGRRVVEDEHLVIYDMGEAPLVFDASESFFEMNPAKLPEALAADVATVTISEPDSHYPLVRGRELGELLARNNVDLTDPQLADGWRVCHARIASDGSLLGALCAATGIGLAERHLATDDEGGKPAEDRQQALAAVDDDALRSHLKIGCREWWDSPGLCFFGIERQDKPPMYEQGCTLIGFWEECQNQVEIAVAQLNDAVAGRRG
jgi:hypothetical protein